MLRLDDITLARMNARFGEASAQTILSVGLDRFDGEIALVSSFGAESAVLLHMLAQLDRDVPVLMIDTLMLFEETMQYQRDLSGFLGLSNVQMIRVDAAELAAEDPDKTLHLENSDACCDLRKVRPLERALAPYRASISGRKRYQTGARAQMQPFERDATGLAKVNPLASWGTEALQAYLTEFNLPRHPLVKKGFPSIGCAPCTSRVAKGEDARAGRWRGAEKTECGIHITPDGRIERRTG